MSTPRRTSGAEWAEAARLAIWSQAGSGGSLESLSIKAALRGEWQVPADDDLSAHLPVVIVRCSRVSLSPNKPSSSGEMQHVIEIDYLRLLAETESKDDLIVSEACAVADVFCQGNRWEFPDTTALQALPAGVKFKAISSVEVQIESGFLLEDLAEIEQAKITITIESATYK